MRSRILKLVLAGVAGAATGVAASMLPGRGKRVTPEESERLRRLTVNARGRTGNAIVLEVQNGILSFTYDVSGVEYTAAQDVTPFPEILPADPTTLSGRPALIKYLPENPANSIVVCEEWNGLLFHPVSNA